MSPRHPFPPFSRDMNAAQATPFISYIYGAFEVTGKFLETKLEDLNTALAPEHENIFISVTFSQIRHPTQVLHPALMPGITPAQRERHAPFLWACRCEEQQEGKEE